MLFEYSTKILVRYKKLNENIETKRGIARIEQFLLFVTMFSLDFNHMPRKIV